MEWRPVGWLVCLPLLIKIPLHHKVQKFSSGAGSSGWSCKKGCKTVVVCVVRRPVEWCGELRSACLCVCLFVCLSVCLSSRISQEALVQTSLNILYMLPVAMARSCSDDSAVTLCTSGFVDNVMFSHNGAQCDTGHW